MVLWTAGSSPASHAARKLKLPFETNKKGALLTDRNLQVLQRQRVFALGDVAGAEIEAETANIPPTAQVGPCTWSSAMKGTPYAYRNHHKHLSAYKQPEFDARLAQATFKHAVECM